VSPLVGDQSTEHDGLRLHGLVARAALRVQEPQKLLQSAGVGGVPKESAVAAHVHQILGLELLEVVRKSRAGNPELALDIADDQAVRVRGKQQLHDAEPRLGSHGGKHVSISRHLVGITFTGPWSHISMIAEIWNPVK